MASTRSSSPTGPRTTSTSIINHTHAFREGNGRTTQGIMAVLGRQAGYQVELSPVVAARLNDVRDLAIVRPYGPEQPAQNLEALTLLLRTVNIVEALLRADS